MTTTTSTQTSPNAVETTGSRFSSVMYDPFLWLGERRGMRATRHRLLSTARGQVLEIGAGTGLNLPHYPEDIEELVLTEPVEPMVDRLERRRAALGRTARIVVAPAENLPFEDGSFDTVVSTMVLCTVTDPDQAIAEVQRVLRPGGRLLFIEHVRSPSAASAHWQDRLADAWAGFADGCRCDRDTLSAISSRLDLASWDRARWRGMPRVVQPLVIGEAVASA
ncbi:methyltransferase type 11 [Knoellia sinensis KCTC 19936]|uniref:Methyltransferase type 11 n=1 Tax=Knoellia sinensis KCTC 19936 TaxID=1385520 RepID=A0A0A0JEY1_9MICO|nr:class I SAM-dependent methyltransferase [Knoellia sinensis]KGN34166.1 methyltransferase type 11 [Knoellia sinensis KCTC 19936]